jgi:hypothetical protein
VSVVPVNPVVVRCGGLMQRHGRGGDVLLRAFVALCRVNFSFTLAFDNCQNSDLLPAGRSGNRIPVGGEIFRTNPDRLRAHPASYTMGTGFSQG